MIDVTALFPGIEAYARTATRLHPRRGTPDPTGSHVGAPPLWPVDEPWPACEQAHVFADEIPVESDLALDDARARFPGLMGLMTDGDGRRFAVVQAVRTDPAPNPLVPVAQLRAADVPDLYCPGGNDLLQVLWCPCDHPDVYGPGVSLYWRRAADLGGNVADAPPPHRRDEYLPRPCVLAPEQVVEYPWWQELPPDLRERVRDWDDAHDHAYTTDLSVAPGWKVGGWVWWGVTDLLRFHCPSCGRRLDLLMQIAASEGGGSARWEPPELGDLDPATPEGRAAIAPTGLMLGRNGLLRIFTCRFCPEVPPKVEVV
jgi:hypothetical protein